MKKRFSAILCLLLAAALLCPTGAAAADEPAPEAEIYALVSLTDGGSIVVEDAPDASLMEEADSYELYIEDEAVLSVEHLLAGVRTAVQAPQFYSVDLTFGDVAVFLTGLRAEYIEEIQQRIIEQYALGEDFELADLGFIDTEKTLNTDNDDELCWAASAADMLVYTGWAAQAGYESEDDVFEELIAAHENKGGHQLRAFAWFFNGAAPIGNTGEYGAAIRDYPGSGGYLNDYAFERLAFDHYNRDYSFSATDMSEVADLLRSGCAVGLGVDLCYDDGATGGHAVTIWGFAEDLSVYADDPARYRSIFLTDSDSHELTDADRRDAQDVMSYYQVESDGTNYGFAIDEHCYAYIYDYVALSPYSEDVEKETDPAAPKDKAGSADLSVTKVYLSDVNNKSELKTVVESSTPLYCSYDLWNAGDQTYNGYLYHNATLTDADGAAVSKSAVYNSPGFNSYNSLTMPFMRFDGLAAGDYTLTVAINPNRTASNVGSEAFYYNNTMSVPIKVRDSYLLGDFDNNGTVNILDATKIQRCLAGFGAQPDAAALTRGDVNANGLNIVDATLIQRYLVQLPIPYSVGGKQLYD